MNAADKGRAHDCRAKKDIGLSLVTMAYFEAGAAPISEKSTVGALASAAGASK